MSHTSRDPRPGEVDGIHYFFVGKDEIEKKISEGAFLEYAKVHTDIYGTSRMAVDRIITDGRLPIVDVDVLGVTKLKKLDSFKARYVFIAPPTLDSLKARLEKRGTETAQQMSVRLGNANRELAYGTTPGNFDRVIVNADLQESIAQLTDTVENWFPWLCDA